MTDVRKARKKVGVNLNELAAVLGPGFSAARLSLAERNLIPLLEPERAVILAAIHKLGALHFEANAIAERALNLDFASHCEDIRRQARAIHASA